MKRKIVVSDIHGYYDKFVKLMELCEYKKGIDELFILGDVIHKGPNSIKTLLLIMELQKQYPETVNVVIGNHEMEFLKFVITMEDISEEVDEEYIRDYGGFCDDEFNTVTVFKELLSIDQKQELVDWLMQLPMIVESDGFVFVHAGIDNRFDMDDQNIDTILWGRYSDGNGKVYFDKALSDKILIFGHCHTSYLYNKTTGELCDLIWMDPIHGDKIGIDCGVTDGGNLGALIINYDGTYDHSYISHNNKVFSSVQCNMLTKLNIDPLMGLEELHDFITRK